MAELAGLSVAANVAQFLVIGLKAANYVYEAYSDTEEFKARTQISQELSNDLQMTLQQLRADKNINKIDSLRKLLDSSLSIATKLSKELENIEKYSKHKDRITRLRFSIRALFSKGDIERLQNQLEGIRNQVSHHLVSLTHESSLLLIGEVETLGEKIRASHAKSQAQLNDLHCKIVDFQSALKDATGQVAAEAFETMSRAAKSVANDCLLRHQLEAVLQSLIFETMVNRGSDIIDAHVDTFHWALTESTTTLPKWLSNEHGIFWIQGKAGCGKSTLMKYLEHNRRTKCFLGIWAADKPLLVASHYFWAVGTEYQKNLKGLFQTLLFQILLEDPSLIKEVCPQRMKPFQQMQPWTLKDLRLCFDNLCASSKLPFKICFFIDGLDEFHGDFHEQNELLNLIERASHCAEMKFCVSSRPWLRFQRAFGTSSWQLSVHEHTRRDIETYVEDTMYANDRYLELLNEAPEEVAYLTQELIDAAEGVFLWVFLVTQELLRGLTDFDDDLRTLRATLKDMPQDLEPFLARMLNAIDKKYHFETSVIFSMVSVAPPSFDLSTRHLWACRERRYFMREEMIQDLDAGFLASDPEMWAKTLKENSPSSDQPGLQAEYDATQERRRALARCKDLLQCLGGAQTRSRHGSERYYKIGFLHRSVAEFLSQRNAQNIIESRLGAESESMMLRGREALAHAHLELLRKACAKGAWMDTIEIDHSFAWTLCLARDIRLSYPRRGRLLFYQLWALGCYNQSEDHMFLSGVLEPRQIESKRKQRYPLTKGFPRLDLLSNMTGITSFGSPVHHTHTQPPTIWLPRYDHRRFYQALTCQHCLVRVFSIYYGDQELLFKSGTRLLYTFFQGWRPHSYSFTAMSIVEPGHTRIDKVTLEAPRDVALDLVKKIASSASSASGEPDSRRDKFMEGLWISLLKTIILVHVTRQNITCHMPANILQVCEIVISYGAPRFLDSQLVKVNFNEHWRLTQDSNKQQTGSYKMDSIRLISHIPEISGEGAERLNDAFARQLALPK